MYRTILDTVNITGLYGIDVENCLAIVGLKGCKTEFHKKEKKWTVEGK